jgi:hypothetical protein
MRRSQEQLCYIESMRVAERDSTMATGSRLRKRRGIHLCR